MITRRQSPSFRAVLFAAVLSLGQPISAAELTAATDIDRLKAQLAQQQAQLEQLKSAMDAQKALIEQMIALQAKTDPVKPKNVGQVASLNAMLPAVAPDLNTLASIPSTEALQKTDLQGPSPLSLQIGNSYLTPIGFLDFTSITRNTVSGSGIGTNFGSIPDNTAANAHLSESRLSAQNSRIGARFDSMFNGMHVLGYWESDFLGNNPANVAVTSNSNTMRMRLYWVQLMKDKWEVMAGQSWSLMTPGRNGISPLPGNLFYSQDIDVNYQVGLTWARQPGVRFVYHPTKTWAFAIAAENAEQYVGGSGGGGIVVPTAGLTSTVFTQFNNATQTLGTPNFSPDIIAKIAWDPTSRFHAEIVGLESTFKSYNQATNTHYTKAGAGGSVNLNFEVFKGTRLITNNFWSDGGGRYLFGEAPDLVVKPNGDIGALHAGSTVSGIETTLKNSLFYGYYGGIYVGRYSVIDPSTNKPVGYGYTGSANSQNKAIQEATFGFNQTLWKNPSYGALNFMGQYSYLTRDPWAVATGAPKNAHQNMVYLNLRYTLPGLAPALK